MTREQQAILNLADTVREKFEEFAAYIRELEKRILVLEGGGIVKSSPETTNNGVNVADK